MPDILYGKGSFRRDNGNFTSLNLINMFPEAAPTVEQGVAILSRPGLEFYRDPGGGPIDKMYTKAGLLQGDLFVVSGPGLYRIDADGNSDLLGAMDGDGPPSIASNNLEIVVTRGQTAYSYNGSDFAAITFPDGAAVRAVAFMGGRFLFARDGTQRYYWSELNDGRTVGALSYSAAEATSDAILDLVAVGDNVMILGEESLEVHYLTTSLTLPYVRISQRTRNRGVKATGCAVEFDNALHFIGDDNVVYRLAEVPNRISNHGLEERIGSSATDPLLFTFLYQGHAFLCVRTDSGTWVYDPAGGSDWPEFRTYGLDNFVGKSAVNWGDLVLFGSSQDDTIYKFSDNWTDDGAPLERRFTAAFPIAGGSVPVDALEVECNAGATTASTGPGANPMIEVRASRDGGHTFDNYRTASLGAQGERRKKPRWRRFGQFDNPGAVFDFRVTDPTPLRVSRVLINEPATGRSR